MQNCSSENKLCIFTHIYDICNIDSGVLSSGFPQINLVLCVVDLFSSCSYCFSSIYWLPLVESRSRLLSYALVHCTSL